MLPSRSMAAMCVVPSAARMAAGGSVAARAARPRRRAARAAADRRARGASGAARSMRISAARSRAYAGASSSAIGTPAPAESP